ncbi:T3SS effector HopA1 family protein [Streptomyces violascens]|uniref:T3SS effector HopA1 family protein n=1 Tax=Streptomyces violascens TaxID=67381 RepID=UPI0037894CAB
MTTIQVPDGELSATPGPGMVAPVFRAMLDAVQWRDPRLVVVHQGGISAEVALDGVRAVAELRRVLYEMFHAGRPVGWTDADPDEDFLLRLGESVRVRWNSDPGWRVAGGRPDGGLWVERDGLRLAVDPERHLAPDAPRAVGTEVTVRMPAVRPNISPGFFSVVGSHGPEGPLVRFYLNLPSVSVPSFLSGATEGLEAAGVRYTLKTLADPRAYGRGDGTVLYTEERFRAAVTAVLAEVLAELPVPAATALPPMTERVLPQVGFAEEPVERDGDQARLSFGEQRCDAVARVLARHHGRPVHELYEPLATELAARGVDPLAPHRNLQGDHS